MTTATQLGPNSRQVEDYLGQVARLEADDWAALALKDRTGPSGASGNAVNAARSRARKHGLLSEVDAAVHNARERLDVILDASSGLQSIASRTVAHVGTDDRDRAAMLRSAGVTELRTAAVSGATLLVLRPLLDKHEFREAWPKLTIDLLSLPDHTSVPPIGATAF